MADLGASIVGTRPQHDVSGLTVALAVGITWLAFLLIVFGQEIRDDIRRWRKRRAIRSDPRRGLERAELEREKILP